MDSVNNRALFRRKSQAARDKVREMGRVPQSQPMGILGSFQELMEVASRDRARNLMPNTVQQMQPMQRMPMQGPMMQQPQPVRMQLGGDVALEAYRQGAPEPTLGEQFNAMQASSMGGVDITATPTPRARVDVPSISDMVRANIGDNPEALARYDQLENAITDPNASPEQIQEEVTDAAGVENTTENFRAVTEQITGTRLPSSATVDEINDAIAGVALGGAIGGPRSLAARISEALLVGLQAKRETAIAREALEGQIAVAAAGAGEQGANWLESPEGKVAQQLLVEYSRDGRTPEQAIERINAVAPGLGSRLAQELGENLGTVAAESPAPAPSAGAENAYETQVEAVRSLGEEQALAQARAALEAGQTREYVTGMLEAAGFDPSKL